MHHRDIARKLAHLREQLEELGDDHPELQRRIDGLHRSLEHLRSDLREMREAQQITAEAEEDE